MTKPKTKTNTKSNGLSAKKKPKVLKMDTEISPIRPVRATPMKAKKQINSSKKLKNNLVSKQSRNDSESKINKSSSSVSDVPTSPPPPPPSSSSSSSEPVIEQPELNYLNDKQLKTGITCLKEYIKKSKALKLSCAQRKDLLEAGQKDTSDLAKVIVEVVFKNIPSNARTYIHNVLLPNHWRLKQLEPEDYNVAIFVKHCKPKTEAEKIQFARDRELDIENTHTYYSNLFDSKLDDDIKSRISRIITTKELATEFNTFQKLDRLSKTFDLFISDKQLMSNKMNSLPRRLGRRFWVREKKVPLMLRLDAKNLNERISKVLSTEPFYITGSTSTESIQIGMISQSNEDLVDNLKAFLAKLYDLYGDNVRFIRLRTNWGISLPLYADLSATCPNVVMRRKRTKPKPVIDEFDMLEGKARIAVHPDGSVKILRNKKRKRTDDALNGSVIVDEPIKKVKKIKKSA